MTEPKVHPYAIVEPGAKIGNNVTIEAFAVVKSTVILEDNVVVKSHAYIDGNTTIGNGTIIWPSATIGTRTQDLKYKGETTFVEIGRNCHIREFTTINSSCHENSKVSIGNDCLIMAYCHIAHNCSIGNKVIMANNAMLAGHVTIEDCAVIGGLTPVHQFSRIGCFAMVGGFSRVSRDVPPYTLGGGSPYRFGGLNIVGLKRHLFELEVRRELSKAFRLTYRSGLHLHEALFEIETKLKNIPEIKHWIDFCRNSKRGILGLQGVTKNSEEFDDFLEDDKIYNE
jgi:UDP-N-acetylglucosamine acyltransferase